MKKGKKGGAQPGSRHSSKLSQSKGVLKNVTEVEHLNGKSPTHGDDVLDAARQRATEKTDGDALSPGELTPAEAEIELLESLYGGRVGSLPVIGSGPRPDLVTTIWFGDAGVGNKDIDGHDGSPLVMEGEAWEAMVLKSDDRRKRWKDTKGTSRKAEGLESLVNRKKENRYPWDIEICKGMSKKLGKIFARLPPWLPFIVADVVDREMLVEAVRQLAIEFQKETGRRVLAASIHVESAHDIHVHLIFTDLECEVDIHQSGRWYGPKLHTKHRKAVEAKMIASGTANPVFKDVTAKLEKMYNDGLLEDPRKSNERVKCRALTLRDRPMKSMGPAYCSKTNLWEYSGRDPRVEDVNARAVKRVSFREVVVDKSTDSLDKPVSSGGVYIDYWLWRKWASLVEGLLDEKTREMLPAISKPYIERYIRNGDSLPNPDLDAARKKAYGEVFDKLTETQRALAGPDTPPSTAASLDDLIDEIKSAIAEKEQSVVLAALDIKESFETLEIARDEVAGPGAWPTEAVSMPELVAEVNRILKAKEQKNATEAARLTLVAEATALALANAQTAEQDAQTKVAPIIADATERQKAADLREEGLEFSALARARQKIAGPGAPPSAAKTPPEMVNDIDRILEAKVETKVQARLTQALKQVFARVLKGKPVPTSNSPQVVEQGLMDGLLEIAAGSAMAAWKSVYGYFARKGEQPKGNTPEAINLEVKGLVSRQVAADYQGVFDALGHEPPKNMLPNGFGSEVIQATGKFIASATQKKLVRVLEVLTEDEDPAFKTYDEEDLRALIEKELVVRKQAIEEAKKNLVRSAIGANEMKDFNTPEDALDARVKKFDEIVMLCSTVVWGLNPEAEGLTDKVKKACQELRTLVDEVPAPAKIAKTNAPPANDKGM